MKAFLNLAVRSILAGILVGVVVIVYLSVENRYLGAFLFSFSVIIICFTKLTLFTGKIGCTCSHPKCNSKVTIKNTLIMLLFNIIGIVFITYIFSFAINQTVMERTQGIFTMKLSNTWYASFILSVFCGMVIYIGVECFREIKNDIFKILVLILSTMIFILSYFEHGIANFGFYTIAGWNLKALLFAFINVVGNAVGSLTIAFVKRYLDNHRYEELERDKNES